MSEPRGAGAGVAGYVTFQLGGRVLATPLGDVREIVRLHGVEPLPDMRPPLVGVLDLRGVPLPVLDVRREGTGRGDVLVVRLGDQPTGFCVDRVVAVHEVGELVPGGERPAGLPDYVVGVLRGPAGPVLLVELGELVSSAQQTLAAV